MKSTTRMLAGYKAGRTRRLNQLRQKVFGKLTEISIAESGWVPTITNQAEGGFELWYDMGNGLRQLKFDSREEALDYVLSLFCH